MPLFPRICYIFRVVIISWPTQSPQRSTKICSKGYRWLKPIYYINERFRLQTSPAIMILTWIYQLNRICPDIHMSCRLIIWFLLPRSFQGLVARMPPLLTLRLGQWCNHSRACGWPCGSPGVYNGKYHKNWWFMGIPIFDIPKSFQRLICWGWS